MKDNEKPEAVVKEDPIVMYLVVRESINMSIGKTAAQCAHGSQMLTLKYMELKDISRSLQKKISDPSADILNYKEEYKKIAPYISIFGEWISDAFRKVVLRADEKEWNKLREEIKDQPHTIIRDAGLTELEPGTETVIGLWPVRKSQAPKTVKRLQALK